jgi:hypothetical protein
LATAIEPKLTTKGSVDPVIVKLGKQERSKIKKLLRGQGSLMTEVQATIDELKTSGTISAEAQPVIVVVREKARGLSLFSR